MKNNTTMRLKASYKKRNSLAWFKGNVGSFVAKNDTIDLFQPPILVASKDHAKALYAAQDKGNRYKTI